MARTGHAPPTFQGYQGSTNWYAPRRTYDDAAGYDLVGNKLDSQKLGYKDAALVNWRNAKTYDPQLAAAYARQEQQRFQGGPAVNTAALGQAAQDARMQGAYEQVGAQRGVGGQAQGLRAAMQQSPQAAQAGIMAQNQANNEQVAQRQAIINQRLAREYQQAEANQAYDAEKKNFNIEAEKNNNDFSGSMMNMMTAGMAQGMSQGGAQNAKAGIAMSDERTKDVKRSKPPRLVIMLGGH